jgi:hypothetical protein
LLSISVSVAGSTAAKARKKTVGLWPENGAHHRRHKRDAGPEGKANPDLGGFDLEQRRSTESNRLLVFLQEHAAVHD